MVVALSGCSLAIVGRGQEPVEVAVECPSYQVTLPVIDAGLGVTGSVLTIAVAELASSYGWQHGDGLRVGAAATISIGLLISAGLGFHEIRSCHRRRRAHDEWQRQQNATTPASRAP